MLFFIITVKPLKQIGGEFFFGNVTGVSFFYDDLICARDKIRERVMGIYGPYMNEPKKGFMRL